MKKTIRNTIIILGVLALLAGTLVFLFRDGANKSVGTKALSMDGTEATVAENDPVPEEDPVDEDIPSPLSIEKLSSGEGAVSATETLGKDDNSGTAEVVYDGSNGQHFTVIIPKYIALGSDKTADYQVTVKGDVAQGSKVKVEPQDDDEATEGVNFIMSPAGVGSDMPVDVTQDDVYWNYAEITANEYNGTAKDGHIDGSLLTVGNWSGNMTFLINFEDEYSNGGGAETFADPVLDDWQYTFDREENTIYLRKYTGHETDVVVSSPYVADDGHEWTVKLNDDCTGMFNGTESVKTLSFSDIDTSNVTNMNNMFSGCSNLTSLDVSNFNTSNVTDMYRMFMSCSNLISLDVSNFNTSKVIDMNGMFYNCSELISLDVSNFNTSNVQSMRYMFASCCALMSLDVSGFDTSDVRDMGHMFENCSVLTSLNVSGFETKGVMDMSEMFIGCSGLTSLDVSNFNTSAATHMGYMFSGCSGLTSLDVSNFNTSAVTNMGGMFSGCSGLTSLDVSKFKTSNVTNMGYMFSGCSGLTSLDVSSFRTYYNHSMAYMFAHCSNLKTLDLRSFEIHYGYLSDMSYMFYRCSKLTRITVDAKQDWSRPANGCKTENMFVGCGTTTLTKVTVQ